MKRILLVNKFYYRRGGDCVYLLNLERMLRSHGHVTAVYAMTHPENLESDGSHLFAPEVDFGGGSIAGRCRAFRRLFGGAGVSRSFKRVLAEFKPDVVHLNNIHSYLSPVLARLARRSGARVVWTMHDFKLLCPSYLCLSPSGQPCEKCFRDKMQVVRHRCMKGSVAASVAAWLEALVWSRDRLVRDVDMFICPSAFMRSRMLECGYPAGKLTVLNNFVEDGAEPVVARKREYCYVGRLSREKGVETLLAAASTLPYRLHVAGEGPLFSELSNRYSACPQILFHGRLPQESVRRLLSEVTFSVIPSEWYENNPLGVLESLDAGTPVVASRIGGLPEIVDEGSGILFEPGDTASLRAAVTSAMERQWNHDVIKVGARRFSPHDHYKKLCNIYNDLTDTADL